MSLVTVASFREPYAAHLARSTLEAENIPVFLAQEHLVGVHWLYSYAIGGVKIQVPEEFAESARSILSEDRSSDLQETTEANLPLDPSDTCPVCSSDTIFPAPLERRSKALSLLVNIPFAFHRNFWKCSTCGHEWRVPNPDYSLPALLGYAVAPVLIASDLIIPFIRRIFGWQSDDGTT